MKYPSYNLTFTAHKLFAILPVQATLHLHLYNIKRYGNLNKVAMKSYWPHAITGMWLLCRERVSPSIWTNIVLISDDHEEYASA